MTSVRYTKSSVRTQYVPALPISFPPIVPFKTIVTAGNASEIREDPEFQSRMEEAGFDDIGFVCPLTIYTDDQAPEDGYTFPCDPLIGFKGGFRIKRRYVAKNKYGGSVKSRWSQDDYTITIEGTIIGADADEMKDSVKKLKETMVAGKNGLQVLCPAFEVLDIERISVEVFELPFTPGEENQDFIISGYSDDVHELLIEINNDL